MQHNEGTLLPIPGGKKLVGRQRCKTAGGLGGRGGLPKQEIIKMEVEQLKRQTMGESLGTEENQGGRIPDSIKSW